MIAFAADLHLCRFMWRSRRDLEGDAFQALLSMEQTIKDVWDRQHDKEPLSIVLAGDIFDERRVDGATLKAFTDFVDRWYAVEVPVYFIQGNHDNDAKEAIASIQGAEHIHKTSVEIDGLTFYGLDWMPREDLHKELEAAPACDYVVLHAMFEHLVDVGIASTDISLDDIPEQIKNVLVGDVHIRDISPLRGAGVCVSPGPLHPCNIEQNGPHGVHVLRQGVADWEFHPHQTRTIVRFRCLDEKGLATATEALPAIAAEPTPEHLYPIVEIRYVVEATDEVQALTKKYPQIKFFLKASATGKMVTSTDLKEFQESFQTLTLENSLGVAVNKEKETELHGFLQAMLTSDARTVIENKMEDIPCVQ